MHSMQVVMNRPQPSFSSQPTFRRGAATVELALVLPILAFVFFVGADFSRAFYYSQALTEAAYKGAQYASNADLAARVPFDTAESAALVDLQHLAPKPTVEVVSLPDEELPAVQVTVAYEFRPICGKFGLIEPMTIRRTVWMRLHPSSEFPEEDEP